MKRAIGVEVVVWKITQPRRRLRRRGRGRMAMKTATFTAIILKIIIIILNVDNDVMVCELFPTSRHSASG